MLGPLPLALGLCTEYGLREVESAYAVAVTVDVVVPETVVVRTCCPDW